MGRPRKSRAGETPAEPWLDHMPDAGLVCDGRHVLEVINDPAVREGYGIPDVGWVLRAACKGIMDPVTGETFRLRDFLAEAMVDRGKATACRSNRRRRV